MKRIKLNYTAACTAAVEKALKDVNGAATSFTVTDAKRVMHQIIVFKSHLEDIPMRDRAGAVYTFIPAGPLAKSYNYIVASTQLKFAIGSNCNDVYLIDIAAVSIYPKSPLRRSIALRADSHARYVAARAMDFEILAFDPTEEKRRRAREHRAEVEHAIVGDIVADMAV